MALLELSHGALTPIMQSEEICKPILQVLAIKKIANKHYHMRLSDGCHAIPYALFESLGKTISMYSIVELKSYVIQIIHSDKIKIDKKGLVILELDVLQEGGEIGYIIGNPVKMIVDIIPTADADRITDTVADANNGDIPPAKHPATFSAVQANKTVSTIFYPIAGLNLNITRWTLKAKVTNKTQLKQWCDSSGCFFSVDLLDDSGQIKCTAFTEMAQKYHSFIQVDKMYYISECQIKIANKQLSSINNDYELIIIEKSVIEECNDIENVVSSASMYKFVSLDKIKNIAVGRLADVIGVCTRVSELQEFITRSNGTIVNKREIYLLDQSNYEICLCLWGKEAADFTSGKDNPIVAIRDAKIRKYLNNKHITTSGSAIKRNPEIPQAYELRTWYNARDENVAVNNISTRKDLVKMELAVHQEGSEIGCIIDNPVKMIVDIIPTADVNRITHTVTDANKITDTVADANNGDIPPAKRPATFADVQANKTVARIYPIADLKLHTTGWTLKAKVTNKTELKEWSNSRGSLFSVDLLDDSGQIKCTAFTKMAQKYHSFIQVDKMYYISACQIKIANKQFSSLNNDYELIIIERSVIEECDDIENVVSSASMYKFVSLDKIKNTPAGRSADVIGVCIRVSELQEFITRSNGTIVNKREIYLLDQSNYEICLCLWGKEAADFTSAKDNPIVAIRDAKLSKYLDNKDITTTGSAIKLNPEIPQAYELRTWHNARDENVPVNNLKTRI